ncbi:hypothetical protein H8E50_08405 [bacterium]|nr:hypothetical protein [bacterium]
MKESISRFIWIAEYVVQELGSKKGRHLIQKIIERLGPGNRVRVPSQKIRGRHAEYYWDFNKEVPQFNKNVITFKALRQMFCDEMGEMSGVVMFNQVVSRLGPGGMIRVPMYKCDADICKCSRRHCLWRLQRNEMICNQFRGDNYRELALLFELDERHVRRIIDERIYEHKHINI